MEPEVTNQPKINKNTFKIGSGDLQQQVANNTKRIAAVSVLLKSNRRGNAKATYTNSLQSSRDFS